LQPITKHCNNRYQWYSKDSEKLNPQGLAAGIYFLKIRDKKSGILAGEKIVVR
jgi:hypothetical protein